MNRGRFIVFSAVVTALTAMSNVEAWDGDRSRKDDFRRLQQSIDHIANSVQQLSTRLTAVERDREQQHRQRPQQQQLQKQRTQQQQLQKQQLQKKQQHKVLHAEATHSQVDLLRAVLNATGKSAGAQSTIDIDALLSKKLDKIEREEEVERFRKALQTILDGKSSCEDCYKYPSGHISFSQIINHRVACLKRQENEERLAKAIKSFLNKSDSSSHGCTKCGSSSSSCGCSKSTTSHSCGSCGSTTSCGCSGTVTKSTTPCSSTSRAVFLHY